jgi:uncharacterized BrkB/YihY/UPF0761 family membrane protein
VFTLAAIEFRFLPNPVDVGFVGTGSALGAVVVGLIAWLRGEDLQGIAEQGAVGGLVGGIVACVVWLGGLSGVEFR